MVAVAVEGGVEDQAIKAPVAHIALQVGLHGFGHFLAVGDQGEDEKLLGAQFAFDQRIAPGTGWANAVSIACRASSARPSSANARARAM